jgi:hypothetical protein
MEEEQKQFPTPRLQLETVSIDKKFAAAARE